MTTPASALRLLAASLVLASAALAGCSSTAATTDAAAGPTTGPTTGPTSGPTTGPATAAPSEAAAAGEILYLQRMARLDEQQRGLARLALARSKDGSVRALAQQMLDGRRTTAQDIASALAALGCAAPAADETAGLDWPAMLSDRQMRALTTASDAQLDRLWPVAVSQAATEAVTASRAAATLDDPAKDRDLPDRLVQLFSAEYVAAQQIAGPPSVRATLPPR